MMNFCPRCQKNEIMLLSQEPDRKFRHYYCRACHSYVHWNEPDTIRIFTLDQSAEPDIQHKPVHDVSFNTSLNCEGYLFESRLEQHEKPTP